MSIFFLYTNGIGDQVQSVLDFLSTPRGPRHVPGWLYVVMTTFFIGGSIATKDILKRRKTFKTTSVGQLDRKVQLCASVLSNEETGSFRTDATLDKLCGKYQLRVTIFRGRQSEVHERNFETWEEIDPYLRRHTSLTIDDFKPA